MTDRKLSTELRLAHENRDNEGFYKLLAKVDELEARAAPQPWPPAMAKLVNNDGVFQQAEAPCSCPPTVTRTLIGSTGGGTLRCAACGKPATFTAWVTPQFESHTISVRPLGG